MFPWKRISIHRFVDFVGRDVLWLLVKAALVGVFLFLVEYSFVFTLQGFLLGIGIAEAKALSLPAWYPTGFAIPLLLFLLTGTARAVAIMLKAYLGGASNQAFLRRKRGQIFTYAMAHASDTSSHEMVSLFTDTLNRAGSAVLDLSGLITTLTAVALLFISGFSIAPREMALGIGLLALLLYPTRLMSHIVSQEGQGVNREWSIMSKLIIEGIRHTFFLKAHGLVQDQIDRGQGHIDRYRDHYKRYFLYSAIKNNLPYLGGIIVLCLLSYLSIHFFKTPGGVLVAFFYLFVRCAQGGNELFVAWNSLRFNANSISMMLEFDERQKMALASTDLLDIRHDRTVDLSTIHLTLDQVSFGYHSSTPIIENLSLQLKKGDLLVIQGESGAGKSTILALLLGVYRPWSGRITLNHRDIYDELPYIRTSMAYVGPEPFLFEGTIRDNLLYGHPHKDSVSDDDIHHSLRLALVDDLIASLPKQLQTKFEEHASISTGQKQRLSFARALLRHPSILILDEATANLDSDTETRLLQNLRTVLPGMLTIVVSHKPTFKELATSELLLSSIHTPKRIGQE